MGQKQSREPVTAQVVDMMRTLSPERLGEVEDSVDFLSQRDEDSQLSRAAMVVSQPVLNAIWDNPDDAEYDGL
jgi:hypothetical protein